MNLQIEEHIFRWFQTLELCKSSDGKKLKNNKIELICSLTSSIETGPCIVKLIQTLLKKYVVPNLNPMPISLSVQNYKQIASPTSRYYNWNLIGESLRVMGFNLDKETINLIVLGDLPMINEFLKDLYEFVKSSLKVVNNSMSIESSIELSKSMAIHDSSRIIKSLPLKTKEAIEILSLKSSKSFRESESLMEFFVLALAKSLDLKPNQAAALLTKNTKYLSHVLAKGSKGEFDPIITFFQAFVGNKDVLLKIIQSEDSKKSLNFFFQAIKAGLVSKDAEVSLWTLKTYEIFIEIPDSFGIEEIVWNWLVDCYGIKTLFLCLKRHPECQELILNVLIAFGKKKLFELFNEKLKLIYSETKDLFFVLSRILTNLSENSLTKHQISNSGALSNWTQIALETLQKGFEIDSISTRIQAISLLTEIWRLYPLEFQSHINDFLNMVKSNFGNKSKLLQTFIINELFSLLTIFLNFHGNQNQTVTMIYNILIGFLIENFSETELRELLIDNFIESFSSKEAALSQIPLIESLNIHLATLDTKNFRWNIYDFNLMKILAQNENIPIKSALLFMDLQTKIFLNNQTFAKISMKPFMLIFSNNRKNQAIQDFAFKFARTSLGLYLSLNKKPAGKEKKPVSSKKSLPEYSDQELKALKDYKKALILEAIRDILLFSEEILKNKLKTTICQTIYQMKRYISKKPNKSLMGLLQSIGEDAEKTMKDYETDYYEKLSKMRDDQIKSMEQNYQKNLEIDNISRISGESSKELTTNALTLTLDLSNMGMGPMSISKNSSFQRKMSLPSVDRGLSLMLGKRKLTKADELKMSLLKNPKIDIKLKKKLMSLEQERKDKLQYKDQNMREHEKKMKVRKIKLRKQVESKNKEKGVLAKNIKDHETILLFPLDALEKKNIKENVNNLEIIDYELLEDYEIKMIQENLGKSTKKILNKIFSKYANMKDRSYKPETFERISLAKQTISMVELWTLIKDLETKDEDEIEQQIFARISHENLLKTVKNLVKKDELVMDYDQFEKIMLSISMTLYSNYEIYEGFKKLTSKFSDLIKNRKDFPKSEFSTYYKQNENDEELKEINKKLAENPDFILPDGYTKVTETQTSMFKEYSETLIKQIPEKFQITYQIMDDILKDNFGIELIEKISKDKTKSFVKPINSKIGKLSKVIVEKDDKIVTGEEKKDKKEEIKETDEVKRVKKRKLRTQMLAKQFEEKMKTEAKNKNKEEEGKLSESKKAEGKEKKALAKKQLEELQNNRMLFEQKMKSVWEVKHKKNTEFPNQYHKLEIPTSPEEKLKQEKAKKEFYQFNRNKLEKMRQKFQSLIGNRKKNEEEYITRSNIFVKKIKIFNDKILPEKLKEQREKEFEIKENLEVISQSFTSDPIQRFFKEHEQTMLALFNFLISQTYTPLTFNLGRNTVPLQTLISFVNEFNICPMLFKLKHIINFYKIITKKKPFSVDKVEVGLEYDEFLECVFRIAIKGNEVLNKMCEFLKMGGHIKENNDNPEIQKPENIDDKQENKNSINMLKKAKRNKTQAIIEKNKEVLVDKYQNITKTTANTLLALVFYLGFPLDPKDKEETLERLRNIISFRKIKPTKYRFLELQKKLEGEGYDFKKDKKKKKKDKSINDQSDYFPIKTDINENISLIKNDKEGDEITHLQESVG